MMWTVQARMVEGSNSIRMVRKTSGRLHFMGKLHPIGLFQWWFQCFSAYQSTGKGGVSVVEGQGIDRVDMGTG